MIKGYFFILGLAYIEYFTFWLFLEYKKEITWRNIKFWLKVTPLVCLFFFLIDGWWVSTMIYITFSFPYILILYCMRCVNVVRLGVDKVLVNYYNCEK